MRLLVQHDGGLQEATGEVVRFGRDADCEMAFDPVAFPKVSGLHARVEPTAGGYALVHLSRSNKTLLNGMPVDDTAPLRPGDRIRLGYTGPLLEVVGIEATASPPPAEAGGFEETAQADVRHMALLRGSARAERFEVGEGGVIGRDAEAARFHLDHPHVSRLHASLAVDGRRVVLADLGSANGTFVNGRRLSRPTELRPGDRVEIGPYSLRFDGTGLSGRSRSNNVELVASGVGRVVRDRPTGHPLPLLDDVSLVVRPREFVCLLGPSGSGKSTLLAILSGRVPPDAGSVSVNGEDLFAHFEALKGDIAVVPQRDVLHDSLPVGAALRYTAELRLPPDLSRDEVRSSVADILGVVGLAHRERTAIRHLSGGQLKRASLASELISRPSLIFLDEVTSGLDEQTDREVMELFREVADGGKTVICITHNLANVESACHLVVILAEGGRLAFVGTPDEAKAYFNITRLGDVYRTLARHEPASWQARFRSSPLHRRYVEERLPSSGPAAGPPPAGSGHSDRGGAGSARQAWILTRRSVAIWKGDREALLAITGQALAVALLLGMVFGRLGDVADPVEQARRTVNLLLLLALSSFWFGCNTSAKELVKERAIFLRERGYNLRVGAYLASKLLVLTPVALGQATLLFAIVRVWCGPSGPVASQWLVLASLAAAGTGLGLLISAASRSEEVATALVPLAVIPQIVLAGVIAPLNGVAEWLAKWSISVYWGQQGLEALLPSDVLALFGMDDRSWFLPLEVVLGQAAATWIASLAILRRARQS